MTTSITFAKGGKAVTIDAEEVSEDYSNKLILSIPNILPEQKQDGTLPDKKVIDLLWITHILQIRGNITGRTSPDTKTASEVRDELVSIFKGAETKGGSIVMSGGYSANGYIEKLVIIEKAQDEPTSLTADIAKYGVQITFVEGKSPSGG